MIYIFVEDQKSNCLLYCTYNVFYSIIKLIRITDIYYQINQITNTGSYKSCGYTVKPDKPNTDKTFPKKSPAEIIKLKG